jgi:hypothetical protein
VGRLRHRASLHTEELDRQATHIGGKLDLIAIPRGIGREDHVAIGPTLPEVPLEKRTQQL